MLSFFSLFPLGRGSDERSGSLKRWVHTWWKSDSPAKWLAPEGWFYLSAGQWWFVWCPSPAIADAVLEQMYKAHQKRPQTSAHLFACPRIMTSRWRKKFFKAATFSFTIPIPSSIRGPDMYEPLIVSVCLPLSKHRPWDLRTTKLMGGVEMSSLKLGLGVFCANFASRHGEWKPCREAWCGKCYVPKKWDNYPVKVLKTDEGLPIKGRLQDKHNY
jgi:hypothetical protein